MNKLYLFILLLMFSSNSMATDSASECATLTNERARLNCYDALSQEPMETGTPAPKQFESMATPTTRRPPVSQQSTNTNTAIALIRCIAIHRIKRCMCFPMAKRGCRNHQPNTLSPGDVVSKPDLWAAPLWCRAQAYPYALKNSLSSSSFCSGGSWDIMLRCL